MSPLPTRSLRILRYEKRLYEGVTVRFLHSEWELLQDQIFGGFQRFLHSEGEIEQELPIIDMNYNIVFLVSLYYIYGLFKFYIQHQVIQIPHKCIQYIHVSILNIF